ncbi:MAG: M48 family metallopeptidase [Pseudomonadales bacterium]|nr:M48 family metallopeptidase [Pseudomonadales bacterium]
MLYALTATARQCTSRLAASAATALLLALLLQAALLRTTLAVAAEDIDLPELGDSGAGLMSPAEENALGQAWLRSFRARVPLLQDPLTFEYLENLLFALASQSELERRQLDLVVVDNPTINAFAVPGGVVGIHTGLISRAQTEAQLSSVITHELAHLSQRHFARSVEAAKRANLAGIAGMLAGVVLAATTSGDAATAAIATSQAAVLDSRLRYSRLHEREADRIGMQTLDAAGYPASAAADMFRQMQDAARLYGEGIPEFLRTHPITESRIADAENRARALTAKPATANIDYQLVRARLKVHGQGDGKASIKHFKFALQQAQQNLSGNGNSESFSHARPQPHYWQVQQDAARYGLALAYHKNSEPDQARITLQPLLEKIPGRIAYTLLDIEIDLGKKDYQTAEQRLRDLYAITPRNYAISMLLAETLLKNKNYSAAQQVLEELAKVRPKQADVWYLLAETQGLAGDILNLHLSRAEFFLLRGNFGQTRKHLDYALRIAGNDFKVTARIKQRLRDIVASQRMLEQL